MNETKSGDTEAAAGGAPRGDLETLVTRLKEHPLQYALSVGFILACALAGVLYRMQSTYAERDAATDFARALEISDPLARGEALKELAGKKTVFSAEALYMQGEAYFGGGDYDGAAAAFAGLREAHSDFEFVPDAVEGLGFVEEERGNYAGALAFYREVREKWPGSFAGSRQLYNVGRCEERMGRLEAAVAAYQEQLEVFPRSSVASLSQEGLVRLRRTNPELFEEPDLVLGGEGEDISEALESLFGDE